MVHCSAVSSLTSIQGEYKVVTDSENQQVQDWEELMFLYRSALQKMETKIGILNDEFQSFYNTNPIEHVKSRIKSAKSIAEKLRNLGYEDTIENMEKHLTDVAGIRVICSFMSDVMVIAEKIKQQEDVTVILVKDYMSKPKPNGYKSYHMVVTIPVYTRGKCVQVPVEIQIRTIAMDFWASLEHKINYKYEGVMPEDLINDLKECADMVELLDKRMQFISASVLASEE